MQSTINVRKNHPEKRSRPLIYWDVVLTLLPAQIGGSNIGVIIEQILPETLLLILSILVVFFAAFKSGKKGLYLWKKESEKIKEQSLLGNIELSNLESTSEKIEMVQPILIFKVLAAAWAIYAALLVSSQVAVPSCSAGFFVIFFIIYPLIAILVYWGINYVSRIQREDPSSILNGDLAFKDMGFVPPALAFTIGVMCSLLGIGGGELMGPLLLSYNVLPQVSTGTTSMMSLINTCANILHYAILNKINYTWAVSVFFTGFVGGGKWPRLPIQFALFNDLASRFGSNGGPLRR